MTPLDQAFIKAYAQPNPTPAAMATGADRPKLPDSVQEEIVDVALGTSLENMIEALQKTSPGIADAARPATTPQETKDDGRKAPEMSDAADASVPASVSATAANHEPPPSLQVLDFSAPVHRIDMAGVAEPITVDNDSTIPPPHIEVTASEVAQDVDLPEEDTAGSAPAVEPFRPMLQVDDFNWPRVCRQLSETASEELDRLADELADAIAQGQRVLGIAGCQGGEGVTTLVLCAGRRLAKRGLSVAMVDANLRDPKLGKRLGVAAEFGWEEVQAGRLPLGEVVVESVRLRMAVVPLLESLEGTDEPTAHEPRMAEGIETLAAYYDVVLVDLGPWQDPRTIGGGLLQAIAGVIDAVALVQDESCTTQQRLAEVQRCVAANNVMQMGIIKNFVHGANRG